MRACGECKLCCILLPVAQLEKPAGVRCQHLCATGCGIYPNWPDLCQKWECIWRMGFLGPNDRPDKSNAVIWQTTLDGIQVTQVDVPVGKQIKKKLMRWLMRLRTPVIVKREGIATLYVNGKERDTWPVNEPRILRVA